MRADQREARAVLADVVEGVLVPVDAMHEMVHAGREELSEVKVGFPDDDRESGLPPSGPEGLHDRREEYEVAERVDFEQQGDARSGGGQGD